jgi:hypothetical protein
VCEFGLDFNVRYAPEKTDLVGNAKRMLDLLLRLRLDLSSSVSVARSVGELGIDPIPDDGVILPREALVQEIN